MTACTSLQAIIAHLTRLCTAVYNSMADFIHSSEVISDAAEASRVTTVSMIIAD